MWAKFLATSPFSIAGQTGRTRAQQMWAFSVAASFIYLYVCLPSPNLSFSFPYFCVPSLTLPPFIPLVLRVIFSSETTSSCAPNHFLDRPSVLAMVSATNSHFSLSRRRGVYGCSSLGFVFYAALPFRLFLMLLVFFLVSTFCPRASSALLVLSRRVALLLSF